MHNHFGLLTLQIKQFIFIQTIYYFQRDIAHLCMNIGSILKYQKLISSSTIYALAPFGYAVLHITSTHLLDQGENFDIQLIILIYQPKRNKNEHTYNVELRRIASEVQSNLQFGPTITS